MEITKTFVGTYSYMLFAKLRRFFRHSVYRYAVGVALATYAVHSHEASMGTGAIVLRGLFYFLALCLFVLALLVISAGIQWRRFAPLSVTFKEDDIVVNQDGKISARGWAYVISAKDAPETISLVVHKFPHLELFLSKPKMSEQECKVLLDWLGRHGKLNSTGFAA